LDNFDVQADMSEAITMQWCSKKEIQFSKINIRRKLEKADISDNTLKNRILQPLLSRKFQC